MNNTKPNVISTPEDMKSHWKLTKAWWKKVYKEDLPMEFLPFVEDRPLILWLRGQLK